MNVGTVELPLRAKLRGRDLTVRAVWQASDPWAIELRFANGESWWIGRDALEDGIALRVMDRAAFDASVIEIVRAVEPDDSDQLEITRYDEVRQPCSVWFDTAEWQRFLEDTLAIVPFGTERTYIDWAAEFSPARLTSNGGRP